MADIKFRLFIKPPYYEAAAGQDIGWEKVYKYGIDNSPGSGLSFNSYTKVKTLGNAYVFAVCKGRLSVKAPEGYALTGDDNFELNADSVTEGSLPDKVNLFLYLTPSAARLQCLEGVKQQAGEVLGFAYLNLEVSSLADSLGIALDNAVIPAGSLSRETTLKLFLKGQMDIMVEAGAAVGKAAVSEEGSNARYFKFAVLSRLGMFDPSYLLGVFKSEGYLDEDEATWSQFLNVFPYAVPFFNTIDEAEAVSLSQSHIYNMLMLNEIKDKAGLSYPKWREVGDNQKKLWKDRLKKKYGAILDTGIEAFEYGDLNEDRNIFKLEAIAEHYLDVKEPWDPNIPVILLTDTAQVNFLNPEGLDAQTVSGSPKTIKINDFQLTDRDVSTGYDYIKFDDDIKDNGIYLIESFNKADNTLVLDNQPDFGAINKSGWQIVKSPNLVLIDPFGGNYKGDNASVINASAPQIIELPELPANALINTEFDTIYFRDDTRRTSKTYFIKEYDSNARTVALDWPPEFPNGRSSWSISGGVGGTTSESPYALGPGGNRGYDNYYGVLFVIYNSQIIDTYLWTSYTSRNYANFPTGNMLLSSIQGNMIYSFKSIKSSNAYKNYSYKIMDYHTNTDKCSHAKYYFTDSPNAALDNDGKTEIRLHYGNQRDAQLGVQLGLGSGSAGCLVSPNFNVMRDRLIEFYQEVFSLKNKGNVDDKVNRIYRKNHTQSSQIWTNTNNNTGPQDQRLQEADWNSKIFGTLWLVRPDEKPL